MPLIICPDCSKQISDRVEACPFCGCPSKYFSTPQGLIDSLISDQSITEENKTNSEINNNDTENNQKELISFSFGNNQINYPKSTKKIAKLYGKYVAYSNEFHKKYYNRYASAGSMYLVLTDLVKDVTEDIYRVVDEACKDLYSVGIKITRADFIEENDIDFRSEISDLYNQYNSIQDEKKEIEYQRQVEKASRGRWQGGGFGMKGAIKGAVNAAVLNAGSGLIHSIGDGITKSGDTRYINNKLNKIYSSKENQQYFAGAVYDTFDFILECIKDEMANEDVIDIDIFGSYSEVNSNYETIVKYEKNREKLLTGMVQCFSCIPEMICYYKPVLNELFELDSDLESFLDFWGLSDIYQLLERDYKKRIIDGISNPFVRNIADIGIEVIEDSIKRENDILLIGKMLKGKVQVGDQVVLLNEGFRAGIATDLVSILEHGEKCSVIRTGNKYELILSTKQVSLFSKGTLLVDGNSFKKIESDLYARYYKNGKEIIWGFDEFCSNIRKSAIFNFNVEDRYMSCRGIDFSCDPTKVMDAYGKCKEQAFNENNDVPLQIAKDNDWNDTIKALNAASFSLSYSLGEHYIIRYYFDKEKEMLLAVYMKDIDLSGEDIIIESKTTEIKKQFECPKCGKLLKGDVKFCNFCGEPNPSYRKICSKCGKPIKTDAKFCNYCGEQCE